MKLCIVIATIVLLPWSIFADEPVEDFRLVEAAGEAAVIPAGSDEPMAAKAGIPLSQGDRVVTGAGGSAELATRSGSVIRLENNTSLGLDDLRPGWTTFRLSVGRFLGKFDRTGKSRYRVRTPVAVASVRGTEFALDVAPDGALEAGVVEGEVGFAPDEPAEGETSSTGPTWQEEILTSSQGVSVRPNETPRRLKEIPPPLVRSLNWFSRVRERIPHLRDTWKDLDPAERLKLRRESFRERVQWQVPDRLRKTLPSPRERVKPQPIPRRRPLRTGPKQP